MQRNKVIQFDPSFNRFKEILLTLFDVMIDTIMSLPRLETKIYLDLETDTAKLQVFDIIFLKVIIVNYTWWQPNVI